MKKALTIVYLLLFILIIFIFQMFVIDERELFGVKPNLILISVIVVSLWFGLYTGSIYSFSIGFITDVLFGNTMGLFTISYTITGVLVGFFNYNYRKENKFALLYVTCIATAIFGFVEYIIYFILTKKYNSFLYFIYQILITSILNIVIVYIVYSLLYKIISFFEDRLSIYDT